MPTPDRPRRLPADDPEWQEYLARFEEHRMRWYHWPLLLIDNSADGERLRLAVISPVIALVTLFFLRDHLIHFAEVLAGK